MWRTISSDIEWDYLIFGREQAEYLRGQGKINGVNGLILLPDNWKTPISVKFTYDPGNYSTNGYSLDEWAIMESYGAVFLPAPGSRGWNGLLEVGSDGYYWSAYGYVNINNDKGADVLSFDSNHVEMYLHAYCSVGLSVRLVQDVKK